VEVLKQKIDDLTKQGLPANAAAIETLGAEYRALVNDIKATEQASINIGQMLGSSLNQAFTTMGESLGKMMAGTGTMKSGLQAILGIVVDFAAEFGKALIAVGVGKLALETLVKVPGGAFGIIAAGIALTALASFAKSKLEGGVSGSSGEAPTAGKLSSVPAYASGGIVPGNSYSGDSVLTRQNSGEMNLNTRQQKNLFNQLDSGGSGTNIPSLIRLYVTGEDLEAIINTRQKRSNNLR
jgi:hypothetical protein